MSDITPGHVRLAPTPCRHRASLVKSGALALAANQEPDSAPISLYEAAARALTHERELLDIRRQLEELERDISIARAQLAALMILRPGYDYPLMIPQRTNASTDVPWTLADMEVAALESRPERFAKHRGLCPSRLSPLLPVLANQWHTMCSARVTSAATPWL